MSDKANFKSLEIEPLKYEGSVDDFRAWMDGFLSRADVITLLNAGSQEEIRQKSFDEWKNRGMKGDIINIGQYYPFLITTYAEHAKSPKREVWRVARVDPIHDDETKPPKKWATIMAVEVLNVTTVEFLDGIYYHRLDENGKKIDYARVEFIGDDFSKYAQFIKDEWAKKDDAEDTEVEIIVTGDESIQDGLVSINQGLANMAAALTSSMMQGVLGSIREIDFRPMLLESMQEMLAGITASFRELVQQSLSGLPEHQKTDVYPKILELSDGLDEVEDAIEVITPETLDESLPEIGKDEKQTILDSQKTIMNELIKIRTEIETLKTSITTRSKMEKSTKPRGANRATRDKIRRLAEYRQQAIDERGSAPGWIHTCQDVVHIDSRIAAKYAPELSEKWDDRSFRWKGFDDDD